MLVEHLEQLVKELEIKPAPVQDDKKIFNITLSSTLKIGLKQLDPGVFFSSIIGPCPAQKKEEFYTTLMRANYLGQGTGGAVLGMDPEEKFLTLSLALPYEMNYKGFREGLEDFVNYVEYWKKQLELHQQAQDDHPWQGI
jgi:hypothetical protein